MGTGLRAKVFPVLKINFPVNSKFPENIKFLPEVFKFYGVPEEEANEIREVLFSSVERYLKEQKDGKLILGLTPEKRKVNIEISLKIEGFEKEPPFQFKSENIKIFRKTCKEGSLKIKLEIDKKS
ncbi:MAG: hypothetical protein ACUVUG_08205 [Candidatus Aminicenantia bacterium]